MARAHSIVADPLELTLVTGADNRFLTTLDHLKREYLSPHLVGQDTYDDAMLTSLLEQATEWVQQEVDHILPRAEYTEVVTGNGDVWLPLAVSPIAEVSAITAINPIGDAETTVPAIADLTLRSGDIGWFTTDSGPWLKDYRYSVTYKGGFFLRGDRFETATVAVTAGDFVLSAGSWPTHLMDTGTGKVADAIEVSGFTNAANNGMHKITTLSGSTLTVDTTLTNEVEDAVVKTFVPRPQLSGRLERATMELVRSWWAKDKKHEGEDRAKQLIHAFLRTNSWRIP